MAAAKYNIEIEQGATFSRTIVVTENSSPKNLTGYTGKAQVRKTHGGDLIADFQVTISDAVNGEITWEMPSATTAQLQERKGVYDLEINDGAAVITRLLKGDVVITPEVTQT
jgi:hypothetical protein